VTDPSRAVFLSYASQDTEAAQHLCNALRAAGIEVWFDQSELRGGDTWDELIRRQIKGCYLFVPIISANTQSREEGYFRREWKLAVDRTNDMAGSRPFLLPIVTDGTSDSAALVPEKFREVQWTRLPAGANPDAFVNHVRRLLSPDATMPTTPSILSAAQPRSSPVAASNRPRPQASRSFVPWTLAIVVILATSYFVAGRFVTSKHVPSADEAPATYPAIGAIPEKSVAILPFVDMSEKKDQEYFSDGLSEELIDQLAHSPDLTVIARTSSFQFKGKNEDMRTIGQRLGVANLLEGSVRTSGKTLRVTAQLIKVADGSHLWSQSYDRDMGDIFKIQDSIAVAVVTALKAAFAARNSSSRDRTNNTDAYAAYLHGQLFLKRETKHDAELALAAFEDAVKIDPGYAAGWAAIGVAYNHMAIAGWILPAVAYPKVLKAAEHALSIDPNLEVAIALRGAYEWNYMRDFSAAQIYMERARTLDPTSNANVSEDILFALMAGHVDEAIEFSRQATIRDPLNPDWWDYLDTALQFAGRLPEAEKAARNALEINPGYAGARCALGDVLIAEKKAQAALAIMNEEPDPDDRWCAADALWALGRRTEADALLAEARSKYANSQAIALAEAYAFRNDKDEAFKWLDRAYDNHEPAVTVIGADPQLRNLRGDARFAALLRKMKVPE
jgi:TolB-like protein